MKAIEVKNLSKTIKGHQILNNISFEIENGDFVGIIGRNASGKSMLFKALTGLIIFTGYVAIFNKEVGIKGNFPDNIGCLIERPGFISHYSGFVNLKFLAGIRNIISENDIKLIMENVGLDPSDKRPYHKYSLGMRQKLGIAQAIMEDPKLIFLDEPMNNLDEESVVQMRALFKTYHQRGTTFILTSHNKDDIQCLCSQVYTITNGELVKNKLEVMKYE